MRDMKNKSSITDFDDYKNVCFNASIDDDDFNVFKQNSTYIGILEHVNYEQGQKYIDTIIKDNILDLSKINKFKENDLYGSANICKYGNPFGLISPSTLRYVKILSDLILYFGDLSNFNIIEIGVGYGGQAKIILDYFNIKNYYFVDLFEVNLLAKKYLNKFNYSNCTFLDYNDLPDKEYDLIISNYALTECSKEFQNLYYEKIIKKSKRGYIIANTIAHAFNIENYTQNEWKSIIPNIQIFPDIPHNIPGNYLIVFKNL